MEFINKLLGNVQQKVIRVSRKAITIGNIVVVWDKLLYKQSVRIETLK